MAKRKARGYGAPPKIRGSLVYIRRGGDDATVKASFMYCAIRSMVYEIGQTGAPLGLVDQQCASGQLVEARNDAVKFFLDSDVEWMWMVDSDMGFSADTFSALVASADPVERPVVGALCFGLRLKSTDDELLANEFAAFPTVYVWKEGEDKEGNPQVGFEARLDYPRDSMVQCDATGAACFVVHRSVLEKIRDHAGHVWFDRLVHPSGKKFGEDLSFFARCAQVDVPVYVNTAVKTSHDKGGVCLTEQWWDRYRPLAEPAKA